ncbi:hypothetical protein [Candidatus Harpocratesius sp.]
MNYKRKTTTSLVYKSAIKNSLKQGVKNLTGIEQDVKKKVLSYSRNTLRKNLTELIDEEVIEKYESDKRLFYRLKYFDENEHFNDNNKFNLNEIYLLNDFLQNPIYREISTLTRNPFSGPNFKKSFLNHVQLFNIIKKENIGEFIKFLIYLFVFHEKSDQFPNFIKKYQDNNFLKGVPNDLISNFQNKMVSEGFLLIFLKQNANLEAPLALKEKRYLLTSGEKYSALDKNIEILLDSILKSQILIEDQVTLNLFEDVALIEYKNCFLQKSEEISNHIKRIARDCPFPFFFFLKSQFFQKLQFNLHNNSGNFADWIFVTPESFFEKLENIINNEPELHLYINFIEKSIYRLIQKPGSTDKCLNNLDEAKNHMETKLFGDQYKNRHPYEYEILISQKLKGRIDFHFRNAKKVLFYLFLLTKINLITRIKGKKSNTLNFKSLHPLWNIFFRNVKKLVAKQKKFKLFEGTSLRHLIMQSIRIFEEFWEGHHQTTYPYAEIEKLNDYKQFLKTCHESQRNLISKDETYLIKLFLLFRGTAFETKKYKEEIQNTKNTTLLLLSFEALHLSTEQIERDFLNEQIIKFFNKDCNIVPLKQKLSLLTGILKYIVNPAKNELETEKRTLFTQAFKAFDKFLLDLVNSSNHQESLDLNWFINLLAIYFYVQNQKKKALILDLIGLCFSFESRSLYPECLLMQLKPEIHRIYHQAKTNQIHPYFMIPHSSMAKVLQLILMENIYINKEAIDSAFDDPKFIEKITIIKYFCGSPLQNKSNSKDLEHLKCMKKFLNDVAVFKEFLLFIYESIKLLHSIFENVPFSNIFLYKINILETQKEEVQQLLQQLNTFRLYKSGFIYQYPSWIISLLSLIGGNNLQFSQFITPLMAQYHYCIPIYGLQLQYAQKFNNLELQETIIFKMWNDLVFETIDIYPTYNLGKCKNHWKIYQFPWILDILLATNPLQHKDEYLFLLDYFLMKIPMDRVKKDAILEKIQEFRPEIFKEYETLISQIEKFKEQYIISDYFKISSNDLEPGYSESLGYYIPEPRPSRLANYRYINLPDKIIL